MNIFKKLIGKIRKQKQISEQLRDRNEKNRVFKTESNQKKFDAGLHSSAGVFSSSLNKLMSKYVCINDEFINDLQEMLLGFDVGYHYSQQVCESVKDELILQNITNKDLVKEIIVDKLFALYIHDTNFDISLNFKENKTNVYLVVGVNGVGKTTSIAKIAYRFKQRNKKVLIVAADTFRAGAVDQLKIWAEKINCDIVIPQHDKQDPTSVIYKGTEKGVKENYDLIICDTSGRLQNKTNLMNELKKMKNVINKINDDSLQEVLLVLDATTGQSGLVQAKIFNEITNLTGIILTKIDGTSKGGIILAIKDLFNIPVKLVGFGEKIDDLAEFDLEKYILSLTKNMEFSKEVQEKND